ncbi:MAG: hypothetical protein PHE43_02930 [Candidatus Nanoarchaeia archaeon]|nr:hypothetical protein [Candidatus Nanoarchaeia archaeon]
MNKGQTEIMGLAIVVVLLVIIAGFFLIFSSKKDSGTEEIRETIQTANLMPAILKYSVCDKVTMEEEIRECITSKTSSCNKEDCKVFIKNSLKPVLDAFFGDKYMFTISKDEQDFLEFGNCTGDRILANPYNSGGSKGNRFELNIKLCRN